MGPGKAPGPTTLWGSGAGDRRRVGALQPRHRHAGRELGAGRPAVEALDRRHIGVVAAVTDLHVGLPGEHTVGGVRPDPYRVAAVLRGQQRLEPGVGVDLD